MADNTIDTLSIEIQSSTSGVDKSIERLASVLGRLETKVSGLSNINLGNFSSSMRTLKDSMSGFFGVENFEKSVVAIRKLSNVNAEKMLNAAIGVSEISNALKGMSGIAIPSLEGIDKLIESTRKFGGKSVAQAVQNLPALSDYLTRFVTSLNGVGALTFDFAGVTSLVDNISRLGGAKATQAAANLKPLKDQLLRFVSGLNGIGALNFDTANLAILVASISKLGSKSAGNAVPNIQALGVALKQLMATLSTAPAVSRNLIDMTNALANLASNGSRVSSASRAMQNSLNGYSASALKAGKHTRNFASQIGMLYARFFLLMRVGRWFGKAIMSAMDYIETLNYFNSAFKQVAANADTSDWQKYGYKSAEAYANSFEQRSKQLTQKLTGFNVDESGELTRTGLPSLGLDPDKVLQYQATFAQMASSMGVASETSLKLSNALTMIGADLASVRNMKFEKVWEDMASGMVGMSRTWDKYGVNIRNVNLQQELYNLGIDRSITKLNQQDKAVLRTIVLLNSTRYAWSDLSRTINQPANQLRLLQSNFASLARTLGSLFIPIITKVLPYINALVIALQRLFSWIGGLLGIKLSGFTSSVGGAAVDMGDFADSADDAAGGLGDAAKNAKKLNGYIADWHEVNNMTSKDDSGGGGGAGGGGGGGMPELDAALEAALAEYQKAWDKAFANMENRANELADKVVDAFKRIWDTAEPTREALRRLWNEGLAQLGNFTWTALQDFWNEFLVPLGNWSLGTGFPMLIDAINNFLTSINWTDINDALRNFWQALEPFAEKVGEGMIEFFDDLLQVGAGFINFTVPNGINALADALKKISPQTAKDIGYGLGILGTSLVAFKGIKTIAKNLGTLSTNFGKFFKVAGVAKYGAIALGIGGVVLALDKFGYIDVDWGTLSSAFKKLATALGKFAAGIGKGLISFIDGLLDVMSPALEGLINGLAWALDGLGSILDAIPESFISTLAETLATFFITFQTYKAVIAVGGLISSLITNLKLFAGTVSGLVNSGAILSNIALALGPTALGGIAFTAIGGGLLLIANKMAQVTEEAAKNSAIGQFSDAVKNLNDEVSQKTSQIQTSLANTRHDIETTGVAETQVAKDLAAEYENLSSKSSLTADEQARMRDISSQLVDLVPGLSKYIDEQTGYLDIQNQTLEDLIKNQELYAQKQAAEGLLVDAYKQQYEATNNATKAQKEYDMAIDDYLKNARLSASVIQDVKNGTIELTKAQAEADYGHIRDSEFKNKYGVKNIAEFREAYKGLIDVQKEYKTIVSEANQTMKDADNNLTLVQGTITTVNEALEKNNQDMLNDIKNSAEFQQTLIDLGEEFKKLGVALSDEFLDKLAFDDTGLSDDVINMFDTLKNQTEISGEEVKQMFDQLGYDIPKELAENISSQSPAVRTEFATLFANLSAGVSADAPTLINAFDVLGYELPQATIKSLEGQGANAQAKVIQFLGKIESGMKLAAPNLIYVFEALGLEVPTEMIAALASKDAEAQQQAIQLIAQIISGSESKRPELIAQLNDLGVAGGDSLVKGMESKNQEANTSGANIVKESASGAITESKRTGTGTFEEAGQNAVDGYIGKLTSSDTKRKILQAGIEMAETALEGVKKGQNSNSPSKETAKLGGDAVDGYANSLSSSRARNAIMDAGISLAKKLMGGIDKAQELIPQSMAILAKYAVTGFNGGLSNNMDSTYRLVEQWSDGLTERFGFVPEIDVSVPDYKGQYMKAMNPNVGNMSSTMRMELDAKMSQYAYETRQQNELLREQNELLRGIYNKPTIQGSDVFNAWQGEQRKLWNRAHITGVKGID